MEKIDAKRLPNKLNLEMVAVMLGITEFSKEDQLEIILHNQRELGLPLKYHPTGTINAQLVSDGLEEDLDANGNLILFSCGPEVIIPNDGNPLTLGPAVLIGDLNISTFTFLCKGKEYYQLDAAGMHPQSIHLKLDTTYVDRGDLENFLNTEHEEVPTYANPESDHYAPELVLALKLHKALIVEKEGKINFGKEKRIASWLISNSPDTELSGALLKRFTAVIGKKK